MTTQEYYMLSVPKIQMVLSKLLYQTRIKVIFVKKYKMAIFEKFAGCPNFGNLCSGITR